MSSKTVADQFDVMLETAEGFTLSMIKAGISGRARRRRRSRENKSLALKEFDHEHHGHLPRSHQLPSRSGSTTRAPDFFALMKPRVMFSRCSPHLSG